MSLYDKIANALAVIPVIILMTLANVLIALVLSIEASVLLVNSGVSKGVSLGVAILVAIAVTAYIRFQPNIRRYIDTRSQ